MTPYGYGPDKQDFNGASIGFKSDNSTQPGEINATINYGKIDQYN